MTATRSDSLPYLGYGLGLRVDHYEALLAKPAQVQWLEVVSENYMVDGGLPLVWLDRFRERYPLVKVEAQISNRNIDMHEDNFDVAIRFRTQPDSTMVARHLEDARLVVVASPAYLQRAGRPKTLADLGQHECIQFTLPSSGRPRSSRPW